MTSTNQEALPETIEERKTMIRNQFCEVSRIFLLCMDLKNNHKPIPLDLQVRLRAFQELFAALIGIPDIPEEVIQNILMIRMQLSALLMGE